MPMLQVVLSEPIAKAEFHSRLREWLATTNESEIGDSDFKQRAWIHIQDGDDIYRLNSDTKRQGVEDYLALVDEHGDDVQWTVVPNRDGRMNAVGYGPERRQIKRFYLYATS